MKKINEMSDREILELMLANQVNLGQLIYRINDFLLNEHGESYIHAINHKDEIFKKLFQDQNEFIRQLNALVDKEKRGKE